MKKIASTSMTARATLGALFFVTGIFLIVFGLSTARLHSAMPSSGTLNPSGPGVNWVGTAVGGGSTDESTCVDGVNCDTFSITLSGTPTNWTGLKARIVISAADPSGLTDYDLYVHKGDNAGPIVPGGTSAHGGTPPEIVDLDPSNPDIGTGTFSVHVVYFSAFAGFQYSGSATAVSASSASALAPTAPQDRGPKIGFQNFEAPGTLVQVTDSSQGPSVYTVEYIGHDAGEPSIGVNWNSPNSASGVTNFQSDLQTLFINFNDSCPANGQSATWYNSAAPTSQFVDSDPIGFTDRQTGRVFAGELTLTSPTCKVSFTDTDGLDQLHQPSYAGWSPNSGPLGSGIDHETIGGGPYHAPAPPHGSYPNAVYYCSQDLVTAFCLRSDDGGATYGPPIPTYTSQCGGIHGHVKVAPDGTVYLPNNTCGGTSAVVVSEDNGLTWNVRPVQNATTQTRANANLQDPAVGIDSTGKVYFATSSSTVANSATGGSNAVVATSTDRGQTWQNIYDVGAAYGLKNIAFPAAVAADAGRAAVAFYGSTTSGDESANSFNGIWHLYVASTFDAGLHWTATDVTPKDPMQRGCIWMHGQANIGRNLLDFFDMTVDKQGRVQVGYVDGCADGACAQAAAAAKGNAYTARGVIARQSSGRRLIANFDPPNPLHARSAPGMPSLTLTRVNGSVHLSWSEADTGNANITSYRIMRGTASGAETLLTTVSGNQTTYNDTTATNPNQTYYYKVLAVNGVGTSCGNNEVAAPFVGDTCNGLIVQKTPPGHPEQPLQGLAPASLAIDWVAVAEPPGTSNLVFKLKATNLASVPPSSRWRVVWNSYAAQAYDPAAQQFYVGMRADQNGAVTFDYGTIATQVVGLVIGIPTETSIGPLPGSSFNADGTITLIVPKAAVGNPVAGDLLGAVNGRTFTGDTTETQNLERSTLLVDHTFVKGQRDNGHPAATYTVVGNVSCGP
jgi:Fibronectin type III domain